MNQPDIENIEINLLLDAIYYRYGYDFRHYARASVNRRAKQFALRSHFKCISDMIPRLLNDEKFFENLVREFSITVTEHFRDPIVYKKLKDVVFPILKTYPFIKIWHAGCATGEEVYSLAILLKENDLYDKATIFATDFNDEALEAAKQGVYAIENVKQSTINYQKAGGSRSFSDYYYAKYDLITMDKSLKKNVTFANHNLATDTIFGEMHLILCRNVMIYFDKVLQNRVINIFTDSLINGGIFCLGSHESLLFADAEKKYKAIAEAQRIYKKIFINEKIQKSFNR